MSGENLASARSAFNPYADRGQPDEVRFRNRYIKTAAGCWIWLSTIKSDGYGVFSKRSAHRVSYELHRGPIPPGLVIDHLCRVKACVNPDHLEAVTQAENVRRSNEVLRIKQYASRCPSGHDLDAHGLATRQGYRRCRICTAETDRRRYLRRKVAA